MSEQQDTIELYRFEALRLAVCRAMNGMSSLVLDCETGEELDAHERYHKAVEVMALLAQGLRDATEV